MVEIVITSSVLILALMLIRKICWGKINRRLQYSLWILVVIRLLVPASFFTSSLSIMNVAEYARDAANAKWQNIQIEEEISQAEDNYQSDIAFEQKIPEISDTKGGLHGNGIVTESNAASNSPTLPIKPEQGHTSVQQDSGILQNILLIVYMMGAFIIGGCILLCNLKFRKRLMADRQFLGKEGQISVYLTSSISSPCLWGIGKPSIYLTEKSILSQERKQYILCHEMTHYRHRDHIWSVVRILCLVLYWFHPLVWVAARLSMEDGELACDEGTFVCLGLQNREAYGRTLIEMMTETEKKSQLLFCTTGMINSKEEIKKRIKAIALYKKHVFWTAVPVIILAVLLSACTTGREKEKTTDTQGNVENSELTSETKTAEDVILNADGSFRLAEYEVELTGDDEKEKIVFDVAFSADLESSDGVITNQVLQENLWRGSEIFVRILEGKETQTQTSDVAEMILGEYVFSSMYVGTGNLAVVKVDGKKCIMHFSNIVDQGSGVFGYELWQIMPYGTDAVLLEEMNASYAEPTKGNNSKDVINQVLAVGEKLDQYLAGSGTQMLLSVSDESDKCYLYGSQNGLFDKGRRQSAFNAFMTEAKGSGFELQLEDYFYPDGKEPLTKLPEDAEERIRSGEILSMEINKNNTTAGRIDLNGDGKEEVLYLEALGPNYNGNGWNDWEHINSNFRVRVNDWYYESQGTNVEPVLMAFSPDGEQILLAVYDDGPSGDPLTSFYRYDDTGLYTAGEIYADLRSASIDEDGVLKCTLRVDMIQTEWVWAYYEWNGNEIVQREEDLYYYVDDSQWREQEQLSLMLLRKITVFAARSESSKAIEMDPQEVRNIATDGVEWINLEAKDGTSGWIRVESGWLPSEEVEVSELFEGRILAD